MIESKLIEYLALTTGTFGTGLWALNKNQLMVSILWLVSAVLWIVFAQLNGHVGLTVRDAIGVCIYLVGIRTYFKQQRTQQTITERPSDGRTPRNRPDPDCLVCKGRGVHELAGPGATNCRCMQG